MSGMPDVVDQLDEAAERTWSESARLLLDIARPRVVALVVFTGLPALLLGKQEWPSVWTAGWVLFGTALAGGASSAFNAYVERETDARMARTRNRPLPAAAVLPGIVVGYGVSLTVVSTVVLAAMGGALAAAIGLATIAFYVGVYTMWLKPRTPQNIVIGGAAGATAPLIASAAADGHVSLAAWLLFAIIFLWTPPHFWAIAIFRRKEYEAAGFPMMPSVVGDQATRWRSLGYALLLGPVTLAPVALGYLGGLYAVVAAVAWALFVARIIHSMVARRPVIDHRVFKESILYLAAVFFAMFVDAGLR
ncbi:MAG: heme o synthase [Myxococcota bacterium]